MLHSAAKHMLLTVRYFSHSQQLQPLSFLNLRKHSESKLREEPRQDYERHGLVFIKQVPRGTKVVDQKASVDQVSSISACIEVSFFLP